MLHTCQELDAWKRGNYHWQSGFHKEVVQHDAILFSEFGDAQCVDGSSRGALASHGSEVHDTVVHVIGRAVALYLRRS